jgi:hypothetical protein
MQSHPFRTAHEAGEQCLPQVKSVVIVFREPFELETRCHALSISVAAHRREKYPHHFYDGRAKYYNKHAREDKENEWQ